MAGNSTNSTIPIPSTTPLTPERYCVTSLNTLVSLFGVIANLAVVSVICRYPQLRQNCKYLQASLAVADGVCCFGQVINCVGALIGPRLLRWLCLLLSTPNAAGIMWSTYLTMCISLDRCYAIMSPIKYYHTKKSKVCLWFVIVGVVLMGACIIATYSDVDLHDYPPGCFGANSRSQNMSSMINYFNTTAGSVTFFVYITTIVAMKVKVRQISNSKRGEQSSFFKKQVEATASISYVIAFGLILFIFPSTVVLILMGFGAPASTISTMRMYVGLTSSIHSSVNCVFYVWKEPKMRILLKRHIFSCGKVGGNSVVPVSVVPTLKVQAETVVVG